MRILEDRVLLIIRRENEECVGLEIDKVFACPKSSSAEFSGSRSFFCWPQFVARRRIELIFVSGRVANLLWDLDGELEGLVLQDGHEIRFPAALGPLVSPIVSGRLLGSSRGSFSIRRFSRRVSLRDPHHKSGFSAVCDFACPQTRRQTGDADQQLPG